MSALARYFRHYNKTICGYDKTPTLLTHELQSEGIECHFAEDKIYLETVLSKFDKDEVLIIYTPAIPNSNSEMQFVLQNGFTLMKRSQVLGEISKQFKTIAIAGTHGKTTTTTLVTHILKSSGVNCFSFMGGISKNYNTNLLLGEANEKETYFVVEADEYDRSFLTLSPYIALITSVDADHLDIYGDKEKVIEGYFLFSKQVSEQGKLIVKKNVDNELALVSPRLIYSLNLETEYCAQNIRIEKDELEYDIKYPEGLVTQVKSGIPGIHNVENSIAAFAIAKQLGIKDEEIKNALRSFKGVKRRFDIRIKSDKIIFIDDYAHHPEELKAFISSVKKMYPDKKLTGIFQPHLFSRTKDFGDDFGNSLDMLDECILLEIYPAREKPMEGINSKWLLGKMKLENKKVMSKSETLDEIKKNKKEIVLTMGAGDIDVLADKLEDLIVQNY